MQTKSNKLSYAVLHVKYKPFAKMFANVFFCPNFWCDNVTTF